MTDDAQKTRQVAAMAVRRAAVDIYLLQNESALVARGHRPMDWFGAYLVRLFRKADPNNLARLSAAFPAYGMAWMLWHTAPSEGRFYRDLEVGELLEEPARSLYVAQSSLHDWDPTEEAP